MGAIMSLFSAFGLSTAAGLNAYIPLLTIGLVSRYTDLINLAAPFDILENPLLLLGIAIITLLDMIGDKIPAVDHLLHLAGGIIQPVAGAVLFMAANSSTGFVDPTLAAIIGLLAAGVTHGARAAARPVVTASTAGLGTPVVSAAEDGAALTLSLTAIFAPVIGFSLALLGLIGVGLLLWSFVRRRRSVARG